MYKVNPHIKVLIDRLSINTLTNNLTILQLMVAYHTAIIRNILGLLEGTFFIMNQFLPLLNTFVKFLFLSHLNAPSLT